MEKFEKKMKFFLNQDQNQFFLSQVLTMSQDLFLLF